jgi:hypothetical protein
MNPQGIPGRDEGDIWTSGPHLDLQLDSTTAEKNIYQVRFSRREP